MRCMRWILAGLLLLPALALAATAALVVTKAAALYSSEVPEAGVTAERPKRPVQPKPLA